MSLEVQIVDFNKKYEMDIKDFDNMSVKYDNEAQKLLFEKVLVCKMYGVDYKLETETDPQTNEITTTIKYTNYSRIEFKIMFGSGAQQKGVIPKGVFGLVNDFKAYVDDNGTEKLKVDIADPYMFIFAHRTADLGGTDINLLRAHKVIQIPNTHFVTGDKTAEGFKAWGLYAGSSTTDVEYCILGFNKSAESTQWHFYLPSNSYCLEGRTEDIIDLGSDYQGYFDIELPAIETNPEP